MNLPTFRETPLRRTKRGNYVRNIGNAKFNLGKDEIDAAKRRKWIEQIFIENCIISGGGDNHTPWLDAFKEIAREVGEHGISVVKAVSPEEWHQSDLGHFPMPDYSYVDRIRQRGVPVEVIGKAKFSGYLPEATVTGTNWPAKTKVKTALEVVKANRIEGFAGTYQSKMNLERVIEAVVDWFDDDLWLHQLDYAKCKKFIDHWRGRPKTKRGKPASKEWCKDVLSEFKAALKEIARLFPEEFTPVDLDSVNTKIKKLHSDGNKNGIKQNFLQPDDAKAAFLNTDDPLMKLAIAVGINTCSGAAELGRMTVDDFLFDSEHPYAKTIDFAGKHSFLIGTRRKTITHHEALLWPWVAELVKKQSETCRKNGWKYLFTDGEGKPLYRCDEVYQDVGLEPPSTTKPECVFVSRWRKVKSVYSFGKLRKSFSNYLRVNANGEVASLALAHKTDSDDLLCHYANKPFARLFQATLNAESDWRLT